MKKNTAELPANDDAEQSVEEIMEELVAELKPIDYNRMMKAVQKQEDIIQTAAQTKKAAYQDLVKRGASLRGLQRIVDSQKRPNVSNAREQATIRAYEITTGQKDLFRQ